MGDAKISALAAAASLAGTDEFVIATGGASKKVTMATLLSSMPGYEYDYAQSTSAVTVSATVEASPDDVVSLPARTYDGSTIILVEFYCAAVTAGASTFLSLNLWDASTDLGRVGVSNSPAAGSMATPVFAVRRLTPTAASHTYKIRGWRGSANGTVDGSSPRLPMFIRTVRV